MTPGESVGYALACCWCGRQESDEGAIRLHLEIRHGVVTDLLERHSESVWGGDQ